MVVTHSLSNTTNICNIFLAEKVDSLSLGVVLFVNRLKTLSILALFEENTLPWVSNKSSATHAETYIDHFHGLPVDVHERSVAIHLRRTSQQQLSLSWMDVSCCYPDKLFLLFKIPDDLFALTKKPLVPLVEYGFRVVNAARGLCSIEHATDQGLSGAFKVQHCLDLAMLHIY